MGQFEFLNRDKGVKNINNMRAATVALPRPFVLPFLFSTGKLPSSVNVCYRYSGTGAVAGWSKVHLESNLGNKLAFSREGIGPQGLPDSVDILKRELEAKSRLLTPRKSRDSE